MWNCFLAISSHHVVLVKVKGSFNMQPQDSSAVEYCGNLLLSGLAGANIVLLSLDKYKAAANHFQFLEDCIASYSQELRYASCTRGGFRNFKRGVPFQIRVTWGGGI